MAKAYDRVEWRYLKTILVKMGFSDSWVSLDFGYEMRLFSFVLYQGEWYVLREFKTYSWYVTVGHARGRWRCVLHGHLFLLGIEIIKSREGD